MGRTRGVGVALGVAVAVAVRLGLVGGPDCAQYLPPVFKRLIVIVSAPDDHFAAGPDCRVKVSGSGRVGGAGGCPTVRAGIVSAAGVQIVAGLVRPRRSFHCRSTLPCERIGQRARWWCWWLSNCRCWDCICPPVFKKLRVVIIRPRRSFHCRSRLPCERLGQRARWWCWWLSNCPCWDCISRQCSSSCRRSVRPRRSFHCRSTLPCDSSRSRARWWCWWLSNYLCWDCISRRCSNRLPSYPPQTIISLPVQTAV